MKVDFHIHEHGLPTQFTTATSIKLIAHDNAPPMFISSLDTLILDVSKIDAQNVEA